MLIFQGLAMGTIVVIELDQRVQIGEGSHLMGDRGQSKNVPRCWPHGSRTNASICILLQDMLSVGISFTRPKRQEGMWMSQGRQTETFIENVQWQKFITAAEKCTEKNLYIFYIFI